MLLAIPNVLSPEQVAEARKLLESADWVDGKVSAGHQGARVKDNMQLPVESPVARQVGQMIAKALSANPLFVSAALPLHILPPMFNRYSGGQTFGNHVDGSVRVVPGTNLCSFFWLQSMIRDNGQRSLLFDMDVAIQRLGAEHPTHPSVVQLTGVYHNLLRQWAEM